MKPRVLFLNHVGAIGGGELCLLDIARHYGDSGKVLLLTDGPFRKRLKQVGIAVEVLPPSPAISSIRREGSGIGELLAIPGVLKLSWRVAQQARCYDIIYANAQKPLVIGALAGKLARKPVIWHLHEMLDAAHFSKQHRWLAATMANRMVERVIANSRATAAAFMENGGLEDKLRVVYNGIDPAPFESVSPSEVEMLRQALSLGGGPVIGLFGRLASWKGQHVLLEALTYLPRVQALFVGEPLPADQPYAKALRGYAKTLGVAGRAHFLGFRQDIDQLMRLTDVVVHTSVAPEPFGRVILEGLLACRPVVATQPGGPMEIVKHEVSGILVPPGDAKALAEALAGLLADPARARTLAKTGYAVALNKFSLQAMLRGVDQQLEEVAARR